MKRYILSTMAGAALMLGSAYAQQSTTPPAQAPASAPAPAEKQYYHNRRENQADRIQQGVQSGQLTKQQGSALLHNEKRINQEAHRMSAKNGGSLNDRQEARINRQLNRNSRAIRRAK